MELVEELAKPLSTFYHQSWLTGGVPHDWRLSNVPLSHEKGWEDPGTYRPVNLTPVPQKIVEQIGCNHMACTGQPGDQAQPA